MTTDTLLKTHDVTLGLTQNPRLVGEPAYYIAKKLGLYTGSEVAYNLKKKGNRFILEVRTKLETHEI